MLCLARDGEGKSEISVQMLRNWSILERVLLMEQAGRDQQISLSQKACTSRVLLTTCSSSELTLKWSLPARHFRWIDLEDHVLAATNSRIEKDAEMGARCDFQHYLPLFLELEFEDFSHQSPGAHRT
jgi:hypothetical protein